MRCKMMGNVFAVEQCNTGEGGLHYVVWSHGREGTNDTATPGTILSHHAHSDHTMHNICKQGCVMVIMYVSIQAYDCVDVQ